MTIETLVNRVKTLPQDQAEHQVRNFLAILIGPDLKGQLLENRYKRKLRKRIKDL